MKISPHSNPNIRLASLKKLKERETWHKLVVKIIIWKEASSADNLERSVSKLTQTEWNKYRQGIIKNNITQGKEKILSDLKSTMRKIKLNGGFKE